MNLKSIALLPVVMVLVGCAGRDGEFGTDESELAPGVYASLGDSYASGLGAREYYDDGCKRSNHAYGPKIASAKGYELKHVACSGARVSDIRNNQLSALSNATTVVTISVGGNDAGFANVITQCAKPWPTTCWGDIDNANSYIANQLGPSLDSLYNEIESRAPNAQVIVVGYPRIFNGEECNFGARISSGEQAELNKTADRLAEKISSVARAHGFDFVDGRGPFTGHAVCDDTEWVNGLSNPVNESYHPNRAGYDAYVRLISAKL